MGCIKMVGISTTWNLKQGMDNILDFGRMGGVGTNIFAQGFPVYLFFRVFMRRRCIVYILKILILWFFILGGLPIIRRLRSFFFFFIGMLNSACLSTNEDSRVGKGDFSVVFSSKSFLICLSSPSRYPIFLPTFFGRPRFNGVGCDNEPTPLERHYGLLMDHHSGSYMNHYDGSQNPFLIVKCTLIFYLKMLIYFLYKKYTTEGNHKVRAFV